MSLCFFKRIAYLRNVFQVTWSLQDTKTWQLAQCGFKRRNWWKATWNSCWGLYVTHFDKLMTRKAMHRNSYYEISLFTFRSNESYLNTNGNIMQESSLSHPPPDLIGLMIVLFKLQNVWLLHPATMANHISAHCTQSSIWLHQKKGCRFEEVPDAPKRNLLRSNSHEQMETWEKWWVLIFQRFEQLCTIVKRDEVLSHNLNDLKGKSGRRSKKKFKVQKPCF